MRQDIASREDSRTGRQAAVARSRQQHARRPRWRALGAVAAVTLAAGLPAGAAHGDAVRASSPMHLVAEGAGSSRTWIFGLARRGEELWAVGSFGIQVKRGSSAWAEAVPPPAQVPLAIAFAPSGTGVVVGQEGALWEMPANGDHWVKTDIGETQRLFAVAASPAGEFLVAGSFGALWDRPAGQTQWQRVPVKWSGFDGPHLYGAIFVDDTRAAVVGERGTVLSVAHGAITDSAEHGEESLFAITRCGHTLVAAGQEGFVLFGDGSAWQNTRIDTRPDIFGLGCAGGDQVVGTSAGFIEVATVQNGLADWRRWEPNPIRIGWLSTALSANGEGLWLAGQGDVWRTELVTRPDAARAE